MIDWPPRWVAKLRATIHTKLLAAFLLIAFSLLAAAAVGLLALVDMNRRAQETAQLQRKIAAYRQLSHDTMAQLYSVSSALLQPEAHRLETIIRQLKQFGYDLDRLQFLSRDDVATMGRVRTDFEQFIRIVTQAVELIRESKVAEGRRLQMTMASPLADRLERLTGQLVNKAEADMISRIELANEAYVRSRRTVIASALASVALALGLGYVISRSLIDPIKGMERRMREIAAGDFSRRVHVPNRDELGTLASDMNRMSDELGRLYAQLDAAREHAERANLDKSRFLAAASHDLRQPMHALNLWVGNLHLALESEDMESARRAAEAIEGSCISMSASFNAILDLSKLDVRARRAELRDIDLGALIDGIEAEFAPIAKQKGLNLRVRPSLHRPIYARSDEIILGRVFRNLIGNAIKFSHTGGVIVGEIAYADRVRVDVYDTGVGIPEKYWQDVFKEFFQVGNVARDRQQGLGLGLYIVRRSIEVLQDHHLDFFSREKRGSRFSVELPRAHATVERIAFPDLQPRSDRIAGAYVAVVDDDPSALGGLVELLTRWGCLVEGGRSGAEVLRALRQNERLPDLLITDWRLAQGETGLDVARLLHCDMASKTPVLVLTGDPVVKIALEDPEIQFKLIHKPIVAAQLRDALEDMLPERLLI